MCNNGCALMWRRPCIAFLGTLPVWFHKTFGFLCVGYSWYFINFTLSEITDWKNPQRTKVELFVDLMFIHICRNFKITIRRLVWHCKRFCHTGKFSVRPDTISFLAASLEPTRNLIGYAAITAVYLHYFGWPRPITTKEM